MKKKSSMRYEYSRSYLHHIVPVLVWLGAVAGVVGLFYQRSKRFEIVGIAQGQVRQVAASCTGRIRSVSVDLFESVEEGQVVAVLDTLLDSERLQAELNTVAGEVEHLMAQLIPTQETLIAEAANLETNNVADQRRFSVDVENARLRILELKALIASDRITLEDLAMEVKIVQDLVKQDAAAPYELQKVETQYDSLAKKIEQNERLLEQTIADLAQAERRRDEFLQRQMIHPSVDSALEVIRKEVGVQERVMKQLLAELKPVELKAPINGVVIAVPIAANEANMRRAGEKVLRRAGEVVVEGEPVLAIAEIKPAEVVAYVRQVQLGLVQEKVMVELVKTSGLPQIAISQVTSIGPAFELIPQQLWRNPNLPEWGRPVLIKVPPGLELIPGEVVGVRSL
jgi:multidrug resistance efflux pump